MAQWHRTLGGDIGLRTAGFALWVLCYISIQHVVALHAVDPRHWSPEPLVLALTALGFLSASLGSALTLWGRHLFDPVELGERWRRRTQRSEQD